MAQLHALQAIKNATRFVMFETAVPDFEVATHGGSMFVVIYEGIPYGITAKHNLHDFQWVQLIVTNTQFGDRTAGLSAVYYASQPSGAAEGSDILDVALIKFAEDVEPSFFEQTAYDLSTFPLATSESGDDLSVYGAITEKSVLTEKKIVAQFADLQFSDVAPFPKDPVLRTATAKWEGLAFSSIEGVSGGPVFNRTRVGLCGMMVRGTLHADGSAIAHYIDMSDISRLLSNVAAGVKADHYVKIVSQLTR